MLLAALVALVVIVHVAVAYGVAFVAVAAAVGYILGMTGIGSACRKGLFALVASDVGASMWDIAQRQEYCYARLWEPVEIELRIVDGIPEVNVA